MEEKWEVVRSARAWQVEAKSGQLWGLRLAGLLGLGWAVWLDNRGLDLQQDFRCRWIELLPQSRPVGSLSGIASLLEFPSQESLPGERLRM